MAQKEHKRNDNEVDYLKSKTNTSIANTIISFLEEPSIKNTIRKVFIKESLPIGFIMALFFIGIFTLYNSIKSILKVNDSIDLILGIIFIFISLLFFIKVNR